MSNEIEHLEQHTFTQPPFAESSVNRHVCVIQPGPIQALAQFCLSCHYNRRLSGRLLVAQP